MKKDNKILKTSLSSLLYRFSGTDIVSSLKKQYSISTPTYIDINNIDDNTILKKARINESKLESTIQHIKDKGFATPLFIFKYKERYQTLYPRIVYIASRKLKIDSIPCILLDIPEEDMLVFLATMLHESKGSNIVELSLVLNRLKNKFKYTQKEMADVLKMSRPQITNIIRLVQLPSYILDYISNNKLSFGHAKILLTCSYEQWDKYLNIIFENKLSVRDLEKLIYQENSQNGLSKIEQKINKKYKTKCSITAKKITLVFDQEKNKQKLLQFLLENKL